MLPSRSGRSRGAGAAILLLSLIAVSSRAFAEEKRPASATKGGPSPKPSPSAPGLTNIPLPIGHEAKGLVLPDFDTDGHLLGRLEAGSAKRIDLEHVQFTGVKLTTFNENNETDLVIDMSNSVLDLKTKVLSSQQRTMINRVDFQIVGDTMKFDTLSRTGTMTGNVKMVLTSRSSLVRKDDAE